MNGQMDGDFTDKALMAIYENYSLVYETVNRYWPYSLFVYEANGKLKNDTRPLIGDSWPSIPLVDGRQRFARLQPIFAEQKLPGYQPQALR